ncbi:DNA-binding domain protein [Vibrio phage 1.111.B._10N.286.45.E6]|nr:DNA-binding domain protein [Vibrio phage 1.111.A._10N.286.45.E6]AUR88306.1 DNA-binding domain protein [Vibrio phage 1.111.B._10N.286.45.E6]
MIDKFTVASNLQRIMREKDMKPRDLKRIIASNGDVITDSQLSNYLSTNGQNVRTPPYAALLSLAKGLNVSLSALLGEEFEDHEVNTNGLTNCGLVAVSESLGFSKNLTSFQIESNECKPFKTSDIVIIDKSINEVSVGYYLIKLGGIESVYRCVNNGEGYTVFLGENESKFNSLNVLGKVVANLTNQF